MSKDLFDLDGKIAVVTGASRGIGEAIARLLAEYGAHVIVSSRRLDGCQEVADAIVAAGHSAAAMACNIGKMDDIETLFADIEKKHGKLDILVNNAATNPFYGHILDTDLESFQKTVDVNIRGYFFASVAAARIMRKNGGGAIINNASINALQPQPMQAIYSITKGAVVNMTKAFAKECAEFGIRVNALLPGFTKTKFAGALFENEKIYNMAIKLIPLRRHAVPEEMAGAVLYLASNASSFTTGQSIVVDGGMTI
jgi:NAD(P)-dependent dehydrogenase (short-subunit alcohol dehydrogenase family)